MDLNSTAASKLEAYRQFPQLQAGWDKGVLAPESPPEGSRLVVPPEDLDRVDGIRPSSSRTRAVALLPAIEESVEEGPGSPHLGESPDSKHAGRRTSTRPNLTSISEERLPRLRESLRARAKSPGHALGAGGEAPFQQQPGQEIEQLHAQLQLSPHALAKTCDGELALVEAGDAEVMEGNRSNHALEDPDEPEEPPAGETSEGGAAGVDSGAHVELSDSPAEDATDISVGLRQVDGSTISAVGILGGSIQYTGNEGDRENTVVCLHGLKLTSKNSEVNVEDVLSSNTIEGEGSIESLTKESQQKERLNTDQELQCREEHITSIVGDTEGHSPMAPGEVDSVLHLSEEPRLADRSVEEDVSQATNQEDSVVSTTGSSRAKGSGSDSVVAEGTISGVDVSGVRESHSDHTSCSDKADQTTKAKDGPAKARGRDRERGKRSKRADREDREERGEQKSMKNAVGDVQVGIEDAALDATVEDDHKERAQIQDNLSREPLMIRAASSGDVRNDAVKSTCGLESQTVTSIDESASESTDLPSLREEDQAWDESDSGLRPHTPPKGAPTSRFGKRTQLNRQRQGSPQGSLPSCLADANKADAPPQTLGLGDSECPVPNGSPGLWKSPCGVAGWEALGNSRLELSVGQNESGNNPGEAESNSLLRDPSHNGLSSGIEAHDEIEALEDNEGTEVALVVDALLSHLEHSPPESDTQSISETQITNEVERAVTDETNEYINVAAGLVDLTQAAVDVCQQENEFTPTREEGLLQAIDAHIDCMQNLTNVLLLENPVEVQQFENLSCVNKDTHGQINIEDVQEPNVGDVESEIHGHGEGIDGQNVAAVKNYGENKSACAGEDGSICCGDSQERPSDVTGTSIGQSSLGRTDSLSDGGSGSTESDGGTSSSGNKRDNAKRGSNQTNVSNFDKFRTNICIGGICVPPKTETFQNSLLKAPSEVSSNRIDSEGTIMETDQDMILHGDVMSSTPQEVEHTVNAEGQAHIQDTYKQKPYETVSSAQLLEEQSIKDALDDAVTSEKTSEIAVEALSDSSITLEQDKIAELVEKEEKVDVLESSNEVPDIEQWEETHSTVPSEGLHVPLTDVLDGDLEKALVTALAEAAEDCWNAPSVDPPRQNIHSSVNTEQPSELNRIHSTEDPISQHSQPHAILDVASQNSGTEHQNIEQPTSNTASDERGKSTCPSDEEDQRATGPTNVDHRVLGHENDSHHGECQDAESNFAASGHERILGGDTTVLASPQDDPWVINTVGDGQSKLVDTDGDKSKSENVIEECGKYVKEDVGDCQLQPTEHVGNFYSALQSAEMSHNVDFVLNLEMKAAKAQSQDGIMEPGGISKYEKELAEHNSTTVTISDKDTSRKRAKWKTESRGAEMYKQVESDVLEYLADGGETAVSMSPVVPSIDAEEAKCSPEKFEGELLDKEMHTEEINTTSEDKIDVDAPLNTQSVELVHSNELICEGVDISEKVRDTELSCLHPGNDGFESSLSIKEAELGEGCEGPRETETATLESLQIVERTECTVSSEPTEEQITTNISVEVITSNGLNEIEGEGLPKETNSTVLGDPLIKREEDIEMPIGVGEVLHATGNKLESEEDKGSWADQVIGEIEKVCDQDMHQSEHPEQNVEVRTLSPEPQDEHLARVTYSGRPAYGDNRIYSLGTQLSHSDAQQRRALRGNDGSEARVGELGRSKDGGQRAKRSKPALNTEGSHAQQVVEEAHVRRIALVDVEDFPHDVPNVYHPESSFEPERQNQEEQRSSKKKSTLWKRFKTMLRPSSVARRDKEHTSPPGEVADVTTLPAPILNLRQQTTSDNTLDASCSQKNEAGTGPRHKAKVRPPGQWRRLKKFRALRRGAERRGSRLPPTKRQVVSKNNFVRNADSGDISPGVPARPVGNSRRRQRSSAADLLLLEPSPRDQVGMTTRSTPEVTQVFRQDEDLADGHLNRDEATVRMLLKPAPAASPPLSPTPAADGLPEERRSRRVNAGGLTGTAADHVNNRAGDVACQQKDKKEPNVGEGRRPTSESQVKVNNPIFMGVINKSATFNGTSKAKKPSGQDKGGTFQIPKKGGGVAHLNITIGAEPERERKNCRLM